MLNFIVGLANRYRQYFILTILIITSLLLLSLNESSQITHLRKYSLIIYSLLDNLKRPIEEKFIVNKEIQELLQMNSKLMLEISELKEYVSKKDELEKLLKFKKDNPVNVVSGRVILKKFESSGNRFIIDVGYQDGIKLNSPVITYNGVVGFISSLDKNYSFVTTINNPGLRFSVRNARSNALGIASWVGSEFKVYNVSKTQDVKQNDIFITSEYSTIFPAGIPLLKVTNSTLEKEFLFYDITAKPTADLYNLRYVFVLPNVISEIFKLKFQE